MRYHFCKVYFGWNSDSSTRGTLISCLYISCDVTHCSQFGRENDSLTLDMDCFLAKTWGHCLSYQARPAIFRWSTDTIDISKRNFQWQLLRKHIPRCRHPVNEKRKIRLVGKYKYMYARIALTDVKNPNQTSMRVHYMRVGNHTNLFLTLLTFSTHHQNVSLIKARV
jgi:hypothetical protein